MKLIAVIYTFFAFSFVIAGPTPVVEDATRGTTKPESSIGGPDSPPEPSRPDRSASFPGSEPQRPARSTPVDFQAEKSAPEHLQRANSAPGALRHEQSTPAQLQRENPAPGYFSLEKFTTESSQWEHGEPSRVAPPHVEPGRFTSGPPAPGQLQRANSAPGPLRPERCPPGQLQRANSVPGGTTARNSQAEHVQPFVVEPLNIVAGPSQAQSTALAQAAARDKWMREAPFRYKVNYKNRIFLADGTGSLALMWQKAICYNLPRLDRQGGLISMSTKKKPDGTNIYHAAISNMTPPRLGGSKRVIMDEMGTVTPAPRWSDLKGKWHQSPWGKYKGKPIPILVPDVVPGQLPGSHGGT